MQSTDANTLSMVVLQAEPNDLDSQICTGILCPIDPNPWPVMRLPDIIDGWRSIDREKITFGFHPTIVRGLGDDLDSRIRCRAYGISVFTLRGKAPDITPPYLIVPFPEFTTTSITVELEIIPSSLFHLAGYQCYLWIAIMSSIIWEGAWEPPNSTETLVAQQTFFQPGDALPVLVRNQKTLSGVALSGVVILQERVSERVFSASLYLMRSADRLSNGVCLLTACASEIEGIINRFETPFAWVR